MTEVIGPRRLKRRRDTLPALVLALRSLQQVPDDTLRLKRVAAGLGPVLDMPLEAASRIVRHNAPSLHGPRSHSHGTLSTCVAGGLAVLAPLLWFTHSEHSPTSTSVISARATQTWLEQSVSRNAADAARVSPRFEAGAGRVEQQAVQPRVTHPLEMRGPPSMHSPRSKRLGLQRLAAPTHLPAFETQWATKSIEPASPAPASMAAELVVASEPTQTAATTGLAPSVPATPAMQAELVAAPERARRASAALSHSDSESELLLRARQALGSDPQRALHLVSEHEARFPKGELVPEREVLAIEVLRGLGQSAAAELRLRRFAERFPESFYLERLRH